MKANFVGTGLGSALIKARSWQTLKSLPASNPEKAAAVANAIIAERLITRLCPPGAAFLDIGAHIGSVFSEVHKQVPDAKIFAIEAEPEKAKNLTERFNYVELHNVAVGETEGTATFFINPAQTGYNSLVRGGEGTKEIQVNVRLLDKLFPEMTFDLIKIDIEGAELGALRGGTELLGRGQPTIMFESTELGVNALGYSPDALWDFLTAQGYEVFTPDRLAHDAPPLAQAVFLDAHEYPQRSHNYFAVTKGRRIELRDKARKILGIG